MRDKNGIVIDDTTHSLLAGQQQLALNFEVPSGNDFQLGISDGNTGLYRNDSDSDFPYNIGSVMSITGSSASSDYYYFYYNIEVEVPCKEMSTNVFDLKKNNRKLLKVKDILGREAKKNSNQTLFYLYDDGSVEEDNN